MKRLGNIVNKRMGLITFIILLGVWELYVTLRRVPRWLFPAPSQVVEELYKSRNLLLEHTRITLMEALIGFAIAVVLASIMALIMDEIKILKRIFLPFIIVSQTIPIITLAPLLIVWFGFGIMPKVFVIVLVCFFPIVINLVESFEHLDEDLLNMMRTMEASWWQVFIKFKLPAVLPSFFSGLKISATYSIMGAVIAEWVGAEKGLGIFMTRAMSSYKTAAIFASIVIIVTLSMSMVGLIKWLEKRVMPWKTNE